MEERKKRFIVMVGTAPSAADAPIHNPDAEFWGVNGMLPEIVYPRINRWFQIHRLAGEPGYSIAPGTRSWLEITEAACKTRMERWALCQDPKKQAGDPPQYVIDHPEAKPEMWMFWPEDDIPESVPYPVEFIQQRYGTHFMTSTFSWMLAQAIDEMRDNEMDNRIGLWGVDMEWGTEYFEQRDGMQHFMDLARQFDIEIIMPVTSGLAYKPIPYPFWESDPHIRKLMRQEKLERKAKEDAEKMVEMTSHRLGSLQFAADTLRAAHAPEANAGRIKELEEERAILEPEAEKARQALVAREAVLTHIEWHMNYLKGCG